MSRSRQYLLAAMVLAMPFLAASRARANPIGFIERYALAEDRTAILRTLIPGSEEYYFFHILHYQVSGDLNRAEALLADWEKGVAEQRGLVESTNLIAIRDRQRLLTYGASPERTIDYLRQRLGIEHQHTAPPVAGVRRWPEAFDTTMLDSDGLIIRALQSGHNLSPLGLQRLADLLLAGQNVGLPVDLQWLAHQIQGPWYPRMGELAIAELRSRPQPQDRGFGDRPLHAFLTKDELQQVSNAFPELANNDAFIREMLQRLQADDDTSLSFDDQARLAYLQRVDEYCQKLSEAHNSLKAAALYRLMEAHWMRGEYRRDLLQRYLRLPRRSPLMFIPGNNPNPAMLRNAANLGVDYSRDAKLPPVGDEQPLVRALLEHFLKDADSTREWDGLVNPTYLKQVFAEAKLLAGSDDSDRWYAMLTPEQRQRLNDAIELTIPVSNLRFSDPTAAAAIEVDVKHVDELVVRIYEINSESYYRSHETLINTDIDLDGLVATSEQRFAYSKPAVQRHREKIELPSISGRGTWIVDFLGGGLRARAILRRGDLQAIEQITADGQCFTVLDEQRQPVKGARMLLAGREWFADDAGKIIIPPVDQPLERTAILLDGEVAVPVKFTHRSEQYALASGMAIHREQLQPGALAGLIVRPRLYLNGQAIDPKTMENVSITITASDIDGIETTKRFDQVELDQGGETGVSFRVPNRLATIVATMSGQITTLANKRVMTVTDSRTWEANGIARTERTSDMYLTRDGENWVIEVRGLSGEPIVGAGIQVSLTTHLTSHPVEVTLESNQQGRVWLGPLPDVSEVAYQGMDGTRHVRLIDRDMATWPGQINGTSEQSIHLPLERNDTKLGIDIRLLDVRGGRYHEDLSAKYLSMAAGQVAISPLPKGDYRLVRRQGSVYTETTLAITAGKEVNGVAIGATRHLDLAWPTPAAIESIVFDEQGMMIRLAGDRAAARVHVLGSRYLNPRESLHLPAPDGRVRGTSIAENGYVSDLRLGEEYLYVLRRQYAKKYPGVMLPQPSLLVAPWETDITSNRQEELQSGDAMPPASAAMADSARGVDRAAQEAREQQGQVSQNYAFLPNSGLVLVNLRPDAEGVIRIPAEQLGANSLFQIVLVDPLCSVERTVARPHTPWEPRDLRLANALPTDKSYAFARGVLVAGPNRPLQMKSIGSAQIQVYRQIDEVFSLYQTLTGDSRFAEFQGLSRWHRLDDQGKRDLYGRLACHELNVFLKFKDPQFFASVVKPYLENKLEKKLVDHWLLDRDLTPWTELWRFSTLNAFEKALLARSIPAMREVVIRELRERIALTPVDSDALRRLIETGLAGKELEKSNEFFFDPSDMPGKPAMDAEAEALNFGVFSKESRGGVVAESSAMLGDGLIMGEPALPSPPGGMGGMGGGGMGAAQKRLGRRSPGRNIQLFQQLDATKQWADNHWDRVRVANTDESLIPINAFWLDWVQHEQGSFLSEHMLVSAQNRHAALLALALLDIPFETSGAELPSDPEGTYQPSHAVAVITKRLQSLEPMTDVGALLVGQRFEATQQMAPGPNDLSEIKVAPDEFLTGVAYRGEIVLSNPTPQPRLVDCLWQIPQGSLPLAGSQTTDSQTIRIEPFAVQRITYQFYFPQPGQYVHYPVCVSNDGKAIARGVERTFSVVTTPTQIDTASWEQVARNGDAAKIQAFLQAANLHQLDWSLVLPRLRERPIYDVVLGVLEQAKLWQHEVWSYALLYRDLPRMKAFLEKQDALVSTVGPVFDSPLLRVQPVERGVYEHLEYAPLVVARIHPLRNETEILNDRFHAQYSNMMRMLAFQRSPDADQQLALCYYFLLQNRIEDAIARFAMIEREQTTLQLQYDYLGGYLALHRGDYQQASQFAAAHVEHPVPRWQQRFAEIATQIAQREVLLSGTQTVSTRDSDSDDNQTAGIRSDAADLAILDRDRRQAESATATTDVRLRIEGDQLLIDYRNTKSVSLRFYGVDLELMFSKNPFVRDGLERLATVRPGKSEELVLSGNEGTAQYRLGEAIARQTWLVEVVSGPARATALYYGGQLKTYVSEGYGQLQVSDRTNGAPVAGAYVKVYSRGNDGTVSFYKDGYTDLRGRFDYATLSGGELSAVQRLSLLVIDPERGATLHDVAPPTR